MPQDLNRVTRRGFLKTAAVAAAAPYVLASSVLGAEGRPPPSGRIAMGFIGTGTQGGGHLVGGAWTYLTGGYLARDDVQVMAVCDIRKARREELVTRCNNYYTEKREKGTYKAVNAINDFRDLLARPDIDAVLIGSPAHWHALMANMAAKAGKDVYCEKPIALVIAEGRAMADAVTRYGRVYQAGTQQRSCYDGKFRRACEYVRSGRIGKLQSVYAMLAGGGYNPGPALNGAGRPVPDGIDWDLFLGPAPWRPFTGDLGSHMFGWGSDNWGQHHYDIVQWGIGADDTGPVDIGWEDGKLAYKYANGVVVYGCPYPGEKIGGQGGCIFVGTEGRIAVDRDWLVSYPAKILQQPLGPNDVHLYPSHDHSSNFLDCVRTRKATTCHAEVAHRAISVLLLGGIAEQLHRPLKWDPVKEEFLNDAEANRLRSYEMRAPWHI